MASQQILCLVLTLFTDTAGTTATFYGTTGKEYLGAGAPGVFQPIVVEFANVERNAFQDGATFGEIGVSPGQIKLANPDGDLDYLLAYGGGTAELYLLDSESAAWSSRQKLLANDVDKLDDSVAGGMLTAQLSDGRAAADVLFETDTYLGTNSGSSGLEGTASDLKGKPTVDCLGYGYQCPVPWANASAQIVQLDKIRINDLATNNLYDGLVSIPRDNVRATLAAFLAGTPAAGKFDLYKGDNAADGAYAKLGTTPKYRVTADIEGQARGGTFRTLPGDLFKEILEQRMGIDSSLVSAADVTAINGAMPYALGMWLDENIACREVLNRIAASILGFWGRDASGVYRLFQLKDPSAATSVATFEPILPLGAVASTSADIVAIERLQATDNLRGMPATDITVAYQPAALVTDAGMDTASTLATRAIASQAWRYAKPSSALSDWSAKYPGAQALALETYQATETGAIAVADLAATIFGHEFDRYRVTFRQTASVVNVVDLGAIVTLKYPRYGLDAGKKAQVLGMKYRSVGAGDSTGEVLQCNVHIKR